MKKKNLTGLMLLAAIASAKAQNIKASAVPEAVKSALTKNYPQVTKVSWEKEKGNFEANWGGRSGEDNSAVFTQAGVFVEIVRAIPVTDLPQNIAPYVTAKYKGAKIKEAGKITNAAGKTLYEAEIKGGDLLFDDKGNFIKRD